MVIGARDLDKTGQQLREALNLAPGFTDPLLEDIGLADETLAVGPQAFLEIVAPLDETVSLARWIRKGGRGGRLCTLDPGFEHRALSGTCSCGRCSDGGRSRGLRSPDRPTSSR